MVPEIPLVFQALVSVSQRDQAGLWCSKAVVLLRKDHGQLPKTHVLGTPDRRVQCRQSTGGLLGTKTWSWRELRPQKNTVRVADGPTPSSSLRTKTASINAVEGTLGQTGGLHNHGCSCTLYWGASSIIRDESKRHQLKRLMAHGIRTCQCCHVRLAGYEYASKSSPDWRLDFSLCPNQSALDLTAFPPESALLLQAQPWLDSEQASEALCFVVDWVSMACGRGEIGRKSKEEEESDGVEDEGEACIGCACTLACSTLQRS
ncbi:unnamed protein product [Caretta caretta]